MEHHPNRNRGEEALPPDARAPEELAGDERPPEAGDPPEERFEDLELVIVEDDPPAPTAETREPGAADAVRLDRRPSFLSGADEMADLAPAAEASETASPTAPPNLERGGVEEAWTPGEEPQSETASLESLRGVTESENVVGSGDLLEQLESLDEFEPDEALDPPDSPAPDAEFEGAEAGAQFDAGHEAPMEAGGAEVPQGLATTEARPARSSRALPLAAAAALVVALGGAGYFFFLNKPGPREAPATAGGAPRPADPAPASDADAPGAAGTSARAVPEDGSAEARDAVLFEPDGPTALERLSAADEGDAAPPVAADLVADPGETEPDVGSALAATDGTTPGSADSEPAPRPRATISASGLPPTGGTGDDAPRRIESPALGENEIVVELANGNTFRGELKRSTPDSIVLRVDGGEITLAVETLRGILPRDSDEYKPTNAFPDGFVEFEHGNRIYGKILELDEDHVVLDLAGARLVFARRLVNVDFQDPVEVRSDLQ